MLFFNVSYLFWNYLVINHLGSTLEKNKNQWDSLWV